MLLWISAAGWCCQLQAVLFIRHDTKDWHIVCNAQNIQIGTGVYLHFALTFALYGWRWPWCGNGEFEPLHPLCADFEKLFEGRKEALNFPMSQQQQPPLEIQWWFFSRRRTVEVSIRSLVLNHSLMHRAYRSKKTAAAAAEAGPHDIPIRVAVVVVEDPIGR